MQGKTKLMSDESMILGLADIGKIHTEEYVGNKVPILIPV